MIQDKRLIVLFDFFIFERQYWFLVWLHLGRKREAPFIPREKRESCQFVAEWYFWYFTVYSYELESFVASRTVMCGHSLQCERDFLLDLSVLDVLFKEVKVVYYEHILTIINTADLYQLCPCVTWSSDWVIKLSMVESKWYKQKKGVFPVVYGCQLLQFCSTSSDSWPQSWWLIELIYHFWNNYLTRIPRKSVKSTVVQNK